MAAILLAVWPWTACSTVPPALLPEHDERTVVAEYEFVTTAAHRIAVPASSTWLAVFTLAAEPAPRSEQFEHGQRYLLWPDDCTHAVVRCSYRAYAGADGSIPRPEQLFPGATAVRTLPPAARSP